MLESKEFEITSNCDGLKLYGYYCADRSNVKGIVHFVHGMAEHKERYQDIMHYLSASGFACVILDMRGHGKSVRSEDDLGYFYDAQGIDCVKDIHQVVNLIKKDHPDIPYVLFGHSMGSLLVRSYVKTYDDVEALVVCGSPSKNPMALPALWLVKLMQKIKGDRYRSAFIDKMAFSSYADKFLENYSKNVWLSKYRKNVDAYDKDPLCGFVFTLNGFENLFRLMLNVYQKKNWCCHNKRMPITFIAGEEDPCIVSESAFKDAYHVMEEVGYQKVDHHLFKGMRHEILLEEDSHVVYQYIEQWLEANVA